MIILRLIFICFFAVLEAGTSSAIFAKYPNKYFIETGSYTGGGIQSALSVGFEKVFSIELSPHFYQLCAQKFATNPRVEILQGDSSHVLPQLLQRIDAPATFWLDGHYSWGGTARGDTNSPILAELESIQAHPIKTHTILIDDVRQFGTVEFDFIKLEEIVAKVLEINPLYVIHFEDGAIPNDVLVAQVP